MQRIAVLQPIAWRRKGGRGPRRCWRSLRNGDERLPIHARASLIVLAAQLQALQTLVGSIEKRIIAQSARPASLPFRDETKFPDARNRAETELSLCWKPSSTLLVGLDFFPHRL